VTLQGCSYTAVTLQGCPYTDDEMLAIFMYSDRSESVAVFIAEY